MVGGADNEKKSGSALKECAVKHALSHTPALRKNSSGKRDTGKGSGKKFTYFEFSGRPDRT